MPGKHSPEKLLARRQRALQRGFLKISDKNPCTSMCGDPGRLPSRKDYGSNEDSAKEAMADMDIVFVEDPWSRSSPPLSGDVGSCKDVGCPMWCQKTKVAQSIGTQFDSIDFDKTLFELRQSHDAALALIEQQNATIAGLVAFFQCVDPYASLGRAKLPDACCEDQKQLFGWNESHTFVSCDAGKTKRELIDVKKDVQSLAKSLPTVVQAALDNRVSSLVTCEQFLSLEELVKSLAHAASGDLESSMQAMHSELVAFKDKCAGTFSTIIKKQIQQDVEISDLSSQLHPSRAHASLASSATMGCAATGLSPKKSFVSCTEFLRMAAETRRRLPHIQTLPKPPMMITNPFFDPESDTSNDACDAALSDCTSELPSERGDNMSTREVFSSVTKCCAMNGACLSPFEHDLESSCEHSPFVLDDAAVVWQP